MKLRFFYLLVAISLTITPPVFAQNPQRGMLVISDANTWGRYHALIIGINDYKEWPQLKTAVKDATVIRDILVSRYGFAEKNIILRTDQQASRLQIIRDLRYLAKSIVQNDNLFIYYAGHGQLDDITGDGYWIPPEGQLKNPGTWVANSYIKAVLSSEKVQAKNVVVIADSCYSGSLLRGGPSLMSLDDQRYSQKLAKQASLRSRQVISSGGVEPVADGGADGHSLFAFYLIDALKKNNREVIDLENLFHTKVWKPVTEIGNQRPNVGRLKTPMDQDGQFVLYNAAWVKEQTTRQAAIDSKKQKEAREKAAVASAALEIQRQRFEIEKQKLALEKEQQVQQKALEVERLKLEKQKQEFEYAKLQARLVEMEAKREKSEIQSKANTEVAKDFQAALDRKSLDSRRAARDYYKLALFPIKLTIIRKGMETDILWQSIRMVARVTGDDARVKFSLSYKLFDGLPDSVKLFGESTKIPEDKVWTKKSFFAEYEPDWSYLEQAQSMLDADLALLISIAGGQRINVYLYDYKQRKRYALMNIPTTMGALEKNIKKVLRDFHSDQK